MSKQHNQENIEVKLSVDQGDNPFLQKDSRDLIEVLVCDPLDFPNKLQELYAQLSSKYKVNIERYLLEIVHDSNNHYITFDPHKLDYLYDSYDGTW